MGNLSQKAAKELGLTTNVKIGSGIIDAYAGWIGSVGAKVEMGERALNLACTKNAVEQVFHRLAVVAGTSTCHLVMSRDPIFTPGIWGPYRDVILEGRWLAEV